MHGAVSDDMSNHKTAKWEVIALGELQQPGGVGITQDYNPVTDGPNPQGTDLADNAQNSPEQEVALETWVNMCVDMLNRGEPDEAIIAKLAHDGCPSPQEVLQRARTQPEQQQPISDEIGQDPFKTPAPQDGQTGQMEGLSQQPPVLGKKKDEVETDDWDKDEKCSDCGDSLADSEGEGYDGLCGDCADKAESKGKWSNVRIAGRPWSEYAKSNLRWAAVPGTEVEPDLNLGDGHPVSEIEKFISQMPVVQPSRPYIEARVENLDRARRAIRGILSKVTYSDQQKLVDLDRQMTGEQHALKDALNSDDFLGGGHRSESDNEYIASAPKFRHNAFSIADPDVVPFEGNPRELGAIWAAESPYDAGSSVEDFHAAAIHQASELGMNGDQFNEFLKVATEVAEHRHVHTEEFTAEPVENEGPAEGIFL